MVIKEKNQMKNAHLNIENWNNLKLTKSTMEFTCREKAVWQGGLHLFNKKLDDVK